LPKGSWIAEGKTEGFIDVPKKQAIREFPYNTLLSYIGKKTPDFDFTTVILIYRTILYMHKAIDKLSSKGERICYIK